MIPTPVDEWSMLMDMIEIFKGVSMASHEVIDGFIFRMLSDSYDLGSNTASL
jgi:hypothetical protein